MTDKRDVDDLTKEFIAESVEGLDRMERCLTELEAHPDDRELVAEIFRTVHTIKGTTGFLGFSRLEKLTHAGENLLGGMREGRLAVSAALVSGLLRLLDTLRGILRLIEMTGGEGNRACDDDSELIALLEDLNRKKVNDESNEPKGLETTSIETGQNDAFSALEGIHPQGAEQRRRGLEAFGADVSGGERSLRIGVDVLNRMMNLVAIWF